MSVNLLGIARTALQVHERAVSLTAHNISNAQTEGYTRRRTSLHANTPLLTPIGSIGTGVRMTGIERIRSEWLDSSFRQATGDAAGFGLRRDLLGRVEEILGEPSEAGLAAALDAFWAGWSDLANDPTSPAARAAVRQRGESVAALLNGFDARVRELEHQTHRQLQVGLDQLNALTARVAELNREIVAAEVSGHVAGDLRDARDHAIDALSRLGPIRVIDRADGSNQILLGSTTIVDGADAKTLALGGSGTAASPYGIYDAANPTHRITFEGGELGAMTAVLGRDLPALRAKLDDLADALVRAVNSVHQRDGGAPFFENPAPPANRATAGTLAVSAAVRQDLGAIVAGAPGAPGDNSIALELAALRHNPARDVTDPDNPVALLDGASFASYFQQLVSQLGLDVSTAAGQAAAAETMTVQAATRRDSLTGVSIDEEMVMLIRHQQAYAAAARMVGMADEMIKTVLQMV